MSLQTALKRFRDTMVIEGLPPIGEWLVQQGKGEIGFPTVAVQDGPWPGFFLDWPTTHYKKVGLQLGYNDGTYSDADLYIVFDKAHLPGADPLGYHMMHLVELVDTKMMQFNTDGTYANDFGKGFLCVLLSSDFQIIPDQDVGVVTMVVRFSQYT